MEIIAGDTSDAATDTATSTEPIVSPFLDPNQLAAYLNVNKDWVYDKVSKRELPHQKFGRQLRFRKSDIDAWVSEQSR